MATTHKNLSIHLERASSLAKVCAIALEKGQGSFEQGDIIELLFNEIDSAYACDLGLQNENRNGALHSRAS